MKKLFFGAFVCAGAAMASAAPVVSVETGVVTVNTVARAPAGESGPTAIDTRCSSFYSKLLEVLFAPQSLGMLLIFR